MPVRVAKLASSVPAIGTTTLATVPAGQTWIVKSAIVLNLAGVASDCECWVEDGTGARGSLILNATLSSAGRIDWEGTVAMSPGDLIRVFTSQAMSHFWVSGTKLPGVA